MKKKQVTRKKKEELFNYSELARQARSGEFGNLKLLALSVGVMLLCVVVLLLMRGKSAAPIESHTAIAESSESPDGSTNTQHAVQDAVGSDALGRDVSEQAVLEDAEREDVQSGQLSPEEMKQRFRDMAEHMPDGQVIIF